MLDDLLTEQSNPASAQIDSLPTQEILTILNAAEATTASAVALEIPRIAAAVDAIVGAIEQGGRLFYVGAGTSGRLGVLDASECPPTFGVPRELVRAIIAGGDEALRNSVEGAEDQPESGVRDLMAAGFRPADVLVGIAASGRTPYVLGAVREARKMGAVTCGISCTPDSELSKAVDFPIEPKPGPEVITGSTRLRAGTATKLVLNMISTALMVRLGHVYGNLMVNVQPSNEKLRARACRIVAEATGLSSGEAEALLHSAGNNIRTAVVMLQKKISRSEAEQRLAAAHGRIREALK